MEKLIAPDYPDKRNKFVLVMVAILFAIGFILAVMQPSLTGLYIYYNVSGTNTSPLNGSAYSATQTYMFNVTWENNYTIDTVYFEHNFTGILDNYSYLYNSGNIYVYEWTGLPVGDYVWRSYANNSNGEINQTPQFNYTVVKATPVINLTITPGTNVTYGTITNVTCVSNGVPIYLFRDGVLLLTNTEVAVLNVTPGLNPYNYTCNTTGNSNYTWATTSTDLMINQVTPNVTITFNGAEAAANSTLTVTVPNTVEICVNVTPYTAGANLSLSEKKTSWQTIVNSTTASKICYNRTFTSTTDPLYQASAVEDLSGFYPDNWDGFDFSAYPTDSEAAIVLQEPTPPSTGGGGGGRRERCRDNKDNDGDGLIDYPFDPGCDSKYDDNEYDVRCVQQWRCTSWNACFEGVQTRICVDYSQCQEKLALDEADTIIESVMPDEERECEILPVIETPGEIEVFEGEYLNLNGEDYKIEPSFIQGKAIDQPSYTGVKVSSLSPEEIAELFADYDINNGLISAFNDLPGELWVGWALPAGENVIEYGFAKEGFVKDYNWFVDIFTPIPLIETALNFGNPWVDTAVYDLNENVVVGARIEYGFEPDKAFVSLVSDEGVTKTEISVKKRKGEGGGDTDESDVDWATTKKSEKGGGYGDDDDIDITTKRKSEKGGDTDESDVDWS